MSDLYTRLASVALAQIADKGRNVTFVTPGTGTYNPGAGTYTETAATEATVKAVFTAYSLKDVDGENIRADDKQCLIAASSLSAEPTTKNKIKEGSTVYEVVSVETVQPGDTPILYKLQVRR